MVNGQCSSSRRIWFYRFWRFALFLLHFRRGVSFLLLWGVVFVGRQVLRGVLGSFPTWPDDNDVVLGATALAVVKLRGLFIVENANAEAMLPGVALVALDEEVWVHGFVVYVVELELLVSADTAGDFCGFFFVIIRLDGSRCPRFQLFRVFHCDVEKKKRM